MTQRLINHVRWTALALALILNATRGAAAETLNWNTNQDRVSADVKSVALPRLLEGVAQLTGWHIYLESNTTFNVSARFADLPGGQALRHLLGDLSFALVPQTNQSPHLYVFRSSQKNATQLIHPADLNASARSSVKVIGNELIVRLKPGANIDEIARALGAKVVGRLDGSNAYRLQFTDEASADSARTKLAGNSDVAGIESNYYVDLPPNALKLASGGMPPVDLKLNPPDSSGRIIVGLVDTAVQPLGNDLDKFLLKSVSVAGTSTLDPSVPSHGTSMFENILRSASAASGGSSSLQVVSVDVYGPGQTTSTFDVAAGIVQAVNNGANILNLSLGSPGDSQLLHDIVQQVNQKGIPIFAAAGNDASPEPYYPAAYAEVTSVTSGNQGKLASYANYGKFVDLMVPGSGVVYYANNAFLVNGTSTSTAFVSGMVAATAASQRVPILDATRYFLNSPAFKFPGAK
jgi:subtilase family protein/fervidolysin-like protein